MKYTVVVEVEYHHYEVEAETPEEAAAIVRDGETSGEVHDATVTKVIADGADTWSTEDLRQPHPCRKCGKPMSPKFLLTECIDCYLERRRS